MISESSQVISIDSYINRRGKSMYYLCHAILSEFHLKPEHIKKCDKYYILYWQARHISALLARASVIERQDVEYEPVFMEGLTKSWCNMNPESNIRISFRRVKGKNTGYALIKPLAEAEFSQKEI